MHCQFCGAALEKISQACPFCGSQVVLGDRYEIRAVLGRGAMGEVFYAFDRRLANEVALKRLNPQLAGNQELRESLTREARIMARLSDAGIVRLFDLAEFESGLYLVLEYVCGPNLREMLRAGYRASPSELVGVMAQICQALTAAHQQGVIHRDLKPSNLLVNLRSPEREMFQQSGQMPKTLSNATLKIADFGIAKAIAESKSTLTNAFSGTPGYMAPEQFRGEAPSPATDVYALGVMSYELLTGKMPAQPMPAIPGVHPLVSNVLGLATHPNRQSRFQSASAFYAALYNAVEGRPFEKPLLRPAASPVPVRAILAIILGAFAAIVALTAVVSTSSKPKPVVLSKVPSMPPELLETPEKIVAHSPPRIDEPPAPVAEATGRIPESGLTGPRTPKLKWSISIDTITLNAFRLGKDGAVYFTTLMGELAAVRDGKIAWAAKLGFGPASDMKFDDEGRLWINNMQDIYAFNRDGAGGRLSHNAKMPSEKETPHYTCMGSHQIWGPGLSRLDLDADCNSDSVAARSGGPIYVATDAPELLALNTRGQTLWKLKLPCDPGAVLTGPADRVLYTCKGGPIHNLNGQTETWSHPVAGSTSGPMLIGGDGTLYYSDSPAGSGAHQLYALDSSGSVLATVKLGGDSLSKLQLGAQKQLIAVTNGLHVKIMQFED